MNTNELERRLKSKSLEPVYVIYGAESFLRRQALAMIREAVGGPAVAGGEPDIIELDAAGLDLAALFDDLRTPSLFAPFRLFIVERLERLISREKGAKEDEKKKKGTKRKSAIERLLEYAEHPARNTCLVLVAESLDRRRKAAQSVLKRLPSVECRPLSAGAIPSWCMERARRIGKQMDAAAGRLLVDLAGTNLGQLDGQIESLATLCSDRPRITEKDVTDLVGGDHARRIWDLIDAITARSAATALKALDRLLREPRSNASGIVAVISREFRTLIQVKESTEGGYTVAEIAKQLNKQDWLIRRKLETVRRMTGEELQRSLALLLQADVDCKTLPSRQRRWTVEWLVLRLCGLEAQTNLRRD